MNIPIEGGKRIVTIPTERNKETKIGTVRDEKMESSIVDTMRRYFQTDSGRPRQDLEYAIMDSVKRYFEGRVTRG
jgi:hypothetical protein